MNIIVKTALQLFYEFTQQIRFDSALFRKVIQFTLKYMCHPQLGPLAGQ